MASSKEQAVLDHLNKLIQDGVLQPGGKIPSCYELADILGVNKGTVNRAVSLLVARGVCKRTVGRGGTILAGAEGFKGVIAYRTTILSGHSFASKLMRGVMLAARKRRYQLCCFENALTEDRLWEELCAIADLRGVLTTCSGPAPADYPVPVMACGTHSANSFVCSDDLHGCEVICRSLLDAGHRDIVILAESWNVIRPEGYASLLRQNGIADASERIIPIADIRSLNPANVYRRCREKFPHFTAMICDSDQVALRMILYLEKQGLMIPGDLSITGYGHVDEFQISRSITSVEQFPEDLGYTACMLLMDRIESPSPEVIERLISTELVQGNTVGAQRSVENKILKNEFY